MSYSIKFETFFNNDEVKRFHFPGKLFWGEGTRFHALDLLDGFDNILIIVDQFFMSDSYVKDLLTRFSRRISHVESVRSEPKIDLVDNVIDSLSKPPDTILAIGGGSAIDFAKCILTHYLFGRYKGIGYGDYRGVPPINPKKPVFVTIPTTAGTGAEASRIFVAYASEDKHKVMGRTWLAVADWIYLDPYFLANAPNTLLVNSAFDGFCHLFESFICSHERSKAGDMLSCFGINEIIRALDEIINQNARSKENLIGLQYGSTLGGIAISNVRTGHIHEAAGGLLEHTELSHPETLFVFYRSCINQYIDGIKDRELLLVKYFELLNPHLNIRSLACLLDWWDNLFTKVGTRNKIENVLNNIDVKALPTVRQAIFERVFKDKVWINKECPQKIGEQQIYELIEQSFAQFAISSEDR